MGQEFSGRHHDDHADDGTQDVGQLGAYKGGSQKLGNDKGQGGDEGKGEHALHGLEAAADDDDRQERRQEGQDELDRGGISG